MTIAAPEIQWVKNDPNEHQAFTDGSKFLVALQVGPDGGPYKWEIESVVVDCDGDGASLYYPADGWHGDAFTSWSWDDVEYFALLDGEMPGKLQPEEESA